MVPLHQSASCNDGEYMLNKLPRTTDWSWPSNIWMVQGCQTHRRETFVSCSHLLGLCDATYNGMTHTI